MDPELPKTLTSTSDAASKLVALLGEFIEIAESLKSDLGNASAMLATAHKAVMAQPPAVLEPVAPPKPVRVKEPSPKPVEAVKPVAKSEFVPEPKPPVIHDSPHSSNPEK